MKYFLIVLTIAVVGFSSCKSGQAMKKQPVNNGPTTEDSVATVINTMFTAMRTADGALLKSTFSDSIVFQTIGRTREGATVVRTENPAGFIEQVSKAKPDSLDERISFETIKIDGPLAIAWTPYSFYFNGKFSHCGVNSFQLVRFNGVWKIQYIIDTRRRQGCAQ